MWIVIWKRHVCKDIDNVETCTFAFRDVFRLHGTELFFFFFFFLARIDTLHSRPVISRHAWIENSTSRIWGTDKRSKLEVSFCTKRFRKAISLPPTRFNEWRATGNCLYCRATSPAFQSTHIATILRVKVVCFLRAIVRRCYERGRCVWPRNETSNDDLLRTTSSKRRFVTS